MKISVQEKIQDVEKRLQFTIVLGMFFPVVLEALFNFNGTSQSDIAGTVLKAGIMIFILIMNYLLFEWRKNNLTLRQLDYLSWVFFTTITCYALVVLFFGFVANGNITSVNWLTRIYYPSILVGAMYVPAVGIGIMIWNFLYDSYTKDFRK